MEHFLTTRKHFESNEIPDSLYISLHCLYIESFKTARKHVAINAGPNSSCFSPGIIFNIKS